MGQDLEDSLFFVPDEILKLILILVNYTSPDAFDESPDPDSVQRQRYIPTTFKALNPLLSCYLVCKRFYRECKAIQFYEFCNNIQLFRYHGRFYIDLLHPKSNYSSYIIPARGGWTPRDRDVLTRFYRLRFDPRTFLVHTGDWTFATTQGYSGHHKGCELAVPYACCFDCESANSMGATAEIDLTGTQFAVETSPEGTFHHSGWCSNGSWTFSNDNQVVKLKGGGYCGWTCPTKAGDEDAAASGGWYLKLKIKEEANTSTVNLLASENYNLKSRVAELEKELAELKLGKRK